MGDSKEVLARIQQNDQVSYPVLTPNLKVLGPIHYYHYHYYYYYYYYYYFLHPLPYPE